MANRSLFSNSPWPMAEPADTVNEAGGKAYQMRPKQAIAQYAATGCLNNYYYTDAEQQLDAVLGLCRQLPAEYVAKTAIYSRRVGKMKDMPALLLAHLSAVDGQLLEKVFPKVIDNGKMLRNFVQIVRSGAVGRKSFGTCPKRCIQKWLNNRDGDALFRDSMGQSPSIKDIIRLAHPKPDGAMREELYGYLIGKSTAIEMLPRTVQHYLQFKHGVTAVPPDVPFQMITALEIDEPTWKIIARQAPWNTTRMNLNTFLRHGIFQDADLTDFIAAKLADPEKIKEANAFPYQLLTAFKYADPELPFQVRDALQAAMEIAVANVPLIPGKLAICVDVSASMRDPVTGSRHGSTTVMRFIDMAGLMCAALLRKNPSAEVVFFNTSVITGRELNWRDSVATISAQIGQVSGGGTACSVALKHMNEKKSQADMVIYISDNQSWFDTATKAGYGGYRHERTTEMAKQWSIYQHRLQDKALLVCIDIAPYATTQAPPRKDIYHIAGLGDSVFDALLRIANGTTGPEYLVSQIEAVEV